MPCDLDKVHLLGLEIKKLNVMGQDNNLTWGNIVGAMITTSNADLMADQKWNVIIWWLILKYDLWLWQWHVQATN